VSHVTVIGAGLAGSLLAIYLAKRGIAVDVYEARGDMRLEEVAAGRSINLALSDRGITALREVGMDEYMLAEAVPMYGRMIHPVTGETKLLKYSGREGEYINSVSRAGLNIALMNEAEKYGNVRFHFNSRCVGFDCATGEARMSSGETIKADTVIATDGAGSVVRVAMQQGGVERFDLSQKWLAHGYKELHIPASADGGFMLEKNALHIWPRHQFMMIALPNFDGSFTCTLFLAHKGAGRTAFDRLKDRDSVIELFQSEFPDALRLMPSLVEDFFDNPTGNLGTIKCSPWNSSGRALLLGDAAHAMVPFYGQGMNCAFEDVRVLDSIMSKPPALAGGQIDWNKIYEEFFRQRKPNGDAICDMAEENFYEMRDATADPVFQRKRELETKLEHTYADYFSKYSMVTFREDLPYSVAKEKGNKQDRLLMKLCAEISDVAELDLAAVRKQLFVYG
jgi:kynurenine 3-monooxygenase